MNNYKAQSSWSLLCRKCNNIAQIALQIAVLNFTHHNSGCILSKPIYTNSLLAMLKRILKVFCLLAMTKSTMSILYTIADSSHKNSLSSYYYVLYYLVIHLVRLLVQPPKSIFKSIKHGLLVSISVQYIQANYCQHCTM